jgi:hypothetical protein
MSGSKIVKGREKNRKSPLQKQKEKGQEKINKEIEENLKTKTWKRLEDGDVFAVMQVLEDLKGSLEIPLNQHLVELLAKCIVKFTESVFIPVECAESFLASVGNLLESPPFQKELHLFASSQPFLEAFVDIIVKFSQSFVHRETIQFSFSTHYCFELTLYILLGIVEKPAHLASVLKHLTVSTLKKLFTALGEILPVDILYLTQEMALEILARVSHCVQNQDSSKMLHVTSQLPEQLQKVVLASREEIKKLLIDMRQFLNDLNQSNLNIESYQITGLELNPSSGNSVAKDYDGWLDLCGESVCIQISHPSSFIRFSYQTIKAISSYHDKNSLKVNNNSFKYMRTLIFSQ